MTLQNNRYENLYYIREIKIYFIDVKKSQTSQKNLEKTLIQIFNVSRIKHLLMKFCKTDLDIDSGL